MDREAQRDMYPNVDDSDLRLCSLSPPPAWPFQRDAAKPNQVRVSGVGAVGGRTTVPAIIAHRDATN